jgi:hypothetical protein
MSTARNHHFVPQCYLKHFTCHGDVSSQLAAFDLVEGRQFPATPRNVCAERDFNRVELPGQPHDILETQLANFDGEVDRALRVVTESRSIQDRRALLVLLNLVSVIAARNPSMRRTMEAAHEQTMHIIGDMLASNRQLFEHHMESAKRDGDVPADTEVSFEQVQEFIRQRQYEVTFPHGFHVVTEMEMQDDVLQTLLARDWVLFRAPAGSQFITSDRPVTLWSRTRGRAPVGYRTLNAMVVMPISPEHLLMGQFDGKEGEFDIPREQVATLNQMTATSCARFVYARSADFECYDADDKIAAGPEHLYRSFAAARRKTDDESTPTKGAES